MIVITALVSLSSGLIGVIATLWWQQYANIRAEKIKIFKTLMAYRGYLAAEETIRALNLIDVVFYKHDDVRQCVKALIATSGGNDKVMMAYKKLISCMAKSLGFKKIDWETIDAGGYYPHCYAEKVIEENILRKAQVRRVMNDVR